MLLPLLLNNLLSGGGSGSVAYSLSGATGSYTLTGNAATFKVGRLLSGAAGSYVLTGNAATFKVAHVLSGAAGSYAITGNTGAFSYVPGSGSISYTLSGATGAYTLTGNAATFKVGRLLSGATGAYTFTGRAGTLTYTPGAASQAYTLSGATGSYLITGGEGTFAWSGASTGVGGGGSGKKYYAKVGKKLLVFKTRQGAIDALDSEEDEPEVEISLPAVKAYAKVTGQIEDYNAAYRSEQYAKLLAMFEQMRYDEDVELLMLS